MYVFFKFNCWCSSRFGSRSKVVGRHYKQVVLLLAWVIFNQTPNEPLKPIDERVPARFTIAGILSVQFNEIVSAVYLKPLGKVNCPSRIFYQQSLNHVSWRRIFDYSYISDPMTHFICVEMYKLFWVLSEKVIEKINEKPTQC